MPRSDPLTPRQFVVLNGTISGVVVGFLIWLIYFHEGGAEGAASLQVPALNAVFNSISATLLLAALVAIKRGQRQLHQQLIFAALASSAMFLIGYVYYHYSHGDTLFQGQGWIRPVYLFILATHIILSIVALPMILTSLFLALTERIAAHKRLSRYTWACWMYVSLTGVLVYFMLHVVRWPSAAGVG